MRKIITVLSCLLLVCLFSCSDNDKIIQDRYDINNVSESISSSYEVSKDTQINLSNLESGALYGIFPSSLGSSRSFSRNNNSRFISTRGGTYLLPAQSSTVSFYADEVGIQTDGKINLIKYSQNVGETSDLTIDSADEPLYMIGDEKIYEEYYRINLDDLNLDDKSRVSLTTYQKNRSGGGVYSHDAGIIDPTSPTLSGNRRYMGIFDLSDVDEISLFNQVKSGRKKDGSYGQTSFQVFIESPDVINQNETFSVDFPQIYEIEAAPDKELVLDMKLTDEVSYYDFSSSMVDAEYAEGDHRGDCYPYIFPLSYDSATGNALLYIGKVDDDIVLPLFKQSDVADEKARLREIKAEEKSLIKSVDPKKGKVEITFTKDDYFIPMIFSSENERDLKGVSVHAEFSSNDVDVRFGLSHDGGLGYTADSVRFAKREAFFMDSEKLIYGVLRNPNGSSGKVILHFSYDGSFDIEDGNVYKIDAASLQDEIPSEETTLEFKDSVILENLEMGTLYGIYLPDNNDTGLRGLNRVSPHFYCFIANEGSREFKFSDFDFSSSSGTFKAVKMPLSNTMEVSKNEIKIRYENEQGLFYLLCIPIEISELKDDYPVLYENFVNLDNDETPIKTNTYLLDAKSGEEYEYVLPLSLENIDSGSIYLILRIEVNGGDPDFKYSLQVKNPICVEEGKRVGIKDSSMLRIEGEKETEYVLEMDGSSFSYSIDGDVTYASNGMHVPYFFSINKENSLLYVGKINGPVLLELVGSGDVNLTLREIRDEERELIRFIDFSDISLPFVVEASKEYEPVIFTSDDIEKLMGLTLSSDSEKDNSFIRIMAGHDNGYGYSSRSLDPGDSETLKDYWNLEYVIIENFGSLTISR